MVRKCKLVAVDGQKLRTPVEFEVEQRHENAGVDIFKQQSSIPRYSPHNTHIVECDEQTYDIDRIGWCETEPWS